MIILNHHQNSREWWEAKRGVPSASNADKIITPKTGELSAQSIDYACELISQRMSDGDYWLNGSDYQSAAMANGSVREGESRRCFELERDVAVREVGFCLTDDRRFGLSPDGIIEADQEGLEAKNPTPKVHIRYLYDGILPPAYKPQVHFSLAMSGFKAWNFYSYAPGFESFHVRVEPDDYTDKVKAALEKFWTQYQEMYAKLTRRAA